MKLLLCTLAVALVAVAAPYTQSNGTTIYTYGTAWPMMDVPVNVECSIQLPKDDAIASPPLQSDASGVWYLRALHGTPGRVYVVPGKSGLVENVRIIGTTGREYVAYLRSIPAVTGAYRSCAISWTLPTPKPTRVPWPIRHEVEMTPAPTPTPDDPLESIDLRSLNCSGYAVHGHAAFSVIRVCADDVRTYIEIPDVEIIPVLAAEDAHGGTIIVNYGFRNSFYVVTGHYPHFVLTYSNGRRTDRLDIEQVQR